MTTTREASDEKTAEGRGAATDAAAVWTVNETAEFLGVPVSTLYYWSYRGEGGPRILRIGRSLRYNPHDVAEWAQSGAA